MKTKSEWAQVVFGAKFNIGERVLDRKNLGVEGVIIRMEVGPNEVERTDTTKEVFQKTDLIYIVEWGGDARDRSAFIDADDRLIKSTR